MAAEQTMAQRFRDRAARCLPGTQERRDWLDAAELAEREPHWPPEAVPGEAVFHKAIRALGKHGPALGLTRRQQGYLMEAYRETMLAEVMPQMAIGWKEAAIAWNVCQSIHVQWAKSRDPLYTTRNHDFVRHHAEALAEYRKLIREK